MRICLSRANLLDLLSARFPKMDRIRSFSICADWKKAAGRSVCQESARAKMENGNSPSEGARLIGSDRSFPCVTPTKVLYPPYLCPFWAPLYKKEKKRNKPSVLLRWEEPDSPGKLLPVHVGVWAIQT
jgi:hypothetical protein